MRIDSRPRSLGLFDRPIQKNEASSTNKFPPGEFSSAYPVSHIYIYNVMNEAKHQVTKENMHGSCTWLVSKWLPYSYFPFSVFVFSSSLTFSRNPSIGFEASLSLFLRVSSSRSRLSLSSVKMSIRVSCSLLSSSILHSAS
uniref:Uncharacterized protein n=2 Tax=Opuntia streptacantha TaxID=393608 RepID=A0A7C9DZ17_OPUST